MVTCLFVMSVRVVAFPFEVVTLLVIYFNHCSPAFYFRASLGSGEAPQEEGGSEADRCDGG